MLPRNHPDRIRIVFDDHRLVANAGLILPATLAQHLGLGELVDRHLDLGGAPGRANTGDKLLTLVASALAGGDCIDDADVVARWDRRLVLLPLRNSVPEVSSQFTEETERFVCALGRLQARSPTPAAEF